MHLESLSSCREIAIVFSPQHAGDVQAIYDCCEATFPDKSVYLVSGGEILCSAKCAKYESYVLVGVECPLHPFANAVQHRRDLDEDASRQVRCHRGPVFMDSIYNGIAAGGLDRDSPSSGGDCCEDDVLVVTESQLILDYYSYKYDRVSCTDPRLELKNRVRYLMRENINGTRFREKKMVGIVFTSASFEGLASALDAKINMHARAYKIFLRDVSYERLISIDNLDCIVLVDCPLFQHEYSMHIPVVSPFSVECAVSGIWSDQYSKNLVVECSSSEMVLREYAGSIMEAREYKGVVYRTDERDMKMHVGRRGVAAKYNDEQNRSPSETSS